LSYIDDRDPSEKKFEDALALLHKEDSHALEYNDVEAWTATLRNWLHFWHLIIVFKETILSAALEACDRFRILMQQYNYGIKSQDTQKALQLGSVYFSKQIMDALALGFSHGEAGVVDAIALLPDSEVGTTMAAMLNDVMLRNATRKVNETESTAASNPKTSSAKASASAGKGRGRGSRTTKTKPAANQSAASSSAAGTQGSPDGGGGTPADSSVYCPMYLSTTLCKYGKNCYYTHRIPSDKDEMEKAIQTLKNRGLICGEALGAKCDKFGIARD
jgi:hypothetical protein